MIKVLIIPGVIPPFLSGMTGGELAGAHIIGPDAGEMIHEIIVVTKSHLPSSLIASPMHVYPTLSLEVRQTIGELVGAAAG